MLKFEYPEDRLFFEKLFCGENDTLENYASFFDFRVPKMKKQEFDQIKDEMLNQLTKSRIAHCQLSFHHICDQSSGLMLDHFIPLSSNELNKHLRKMKPSGHQMVPHQSFGSNNIENMIVVCQNCYRHRKHRFVRLIHISKENTHDH